jgi:SH3-like domain-containing protein
MTVISELCDSGFVDKLCGMELRMRRRALLNRLRVVSLTSIIVLLLVGCGLNIPKDIPTEVKSLPTNTLVPIWSMTPKYTATLVPTSTLIPSITPSPTNTEPPATLTATPTLSPTPSVSGAVNQDANLRSGPGVGYKSIRGLTVGTVVTVLGANDDRDWYNVRLEDSTEGWLLASLVTVQNPTLVAVLSTADLTKRAQDASAQPAGTLPVVAATPRKPFSRGRGDVLAYCDNKTNGEPRRTFPAGTLVTIYWSWFAKTPEQLDDHVQQSEYEVRVDGQLLSDWRAQKTDVQKWTDGNYYVFWYVPIGTPQPGEHKIDYKVTWKQQISDGFKTYGPGGDVETDTGSCVFTIK